MDELNFWKKLPAPFIIMAPMEDVTDTVFREIVLKGSEPGHLHVVFTEFTSVDGLLDPRGKDKVAHRLFVNDSERRLLNQKKVKIVAQIWGSDSEKFYKAARYISSEHNFDGIDINMGCPVKKIVKNAACSALINFPDIAGEIVQATKEGTSLPVSVKTRLGFNRIKTEEWISHLLHYKPAAITIHGRTQKMMSNGEVNWQEITKAVQLKNEINPDTRIIGNGDVGSYQEALLKCKEYYTDGIMMGRAIFKNINVFGPDRSSPANNPEMLRKHIELFSKTWGPDKNFNLLKRYFKIYLNQFQGAAHLRQQLYHTESISEALDIINENLHKLYSQHDFSIIEK
jgi:tRNA-dihydrouridine synthase